MAKKTAMDVNESIAATDPKMRPITIGCVG